MGERYIRIGIYNVQDILNKVFTNEKRRKLIRQGIKYTSHVWRNNSFIYLDTDIGMKEINVSRQKYCIFLEKGTFCKKCGLSGEFFALEKMRSEPKARYHLNLYGIQNGVEIMLTKDHIIPKACGGQNHMSNYQVLCQKCNIRKGNRMQTC